MLRSSLDDTARGVVLSLAQPSVLHSPVHTWWQYALAPFSSLVSDMFSHYLAGSQHAGAYYVFGL